MKRFFSLVLFGFSPVTLAATPPANVPIDLTIAGPQEPQTDAEVFDESVIFSPNFAINQNDPALKDLFDPTTGFSNLCFPTAFAEALIDQLAYYTPPLSQLALSGLSTDRRTIDPNALIRQLASACKTNAVTGTLTIDAIQCVTALLKQSNYSLAGTHMVSPFDTNSTLPILSRDVTIQDIRSALKGGGIVLLEAAWFTFDTSTHSWTRNGGHYVTVFGYDYNLSWGENQIQVKVVNPDTNYGNARSGAIWDTLTVERYSPQPGITYPAHRPFIVTGAGFGGATKRGFVGAMISLAPGLR